MRNLVLKIGLKSLLQTLNDLAIAIAKQQSIWIFQKMKNKIAFLIRDLNCGGAQRQLSTLAKALSQQGFVVTILYFYPGGLFEKDLKDSNISLICLEKQGRWHLLSFFWRLLSHLQHIRPDVLHGYLGDSNLLTIFLKPFLPSTLIVWGLRNSHNSSNQYGWVGNLSFQLGRLLCHFADLIIVNSHIGRSYYLNYAFPADKMIVIPNGFDIEKFQPNREAGIEVRKEWGISQDEILVGLIGRLDPLKDHPTFFKAAALLCEQRQNMRFVCVGNGPEKYTQELYELVDELGITQKVVWAGTRADMYAVYNAMDIVASSSYSEGFPNVVGEAMACGVPCVVTDVGDSAWLVGDTGLVIPPSSPEALKTAIEELIEKLGSHGYNQAQIRQRIVEHFSIPQLVQETKTAFIRLSHENAY